MLKLNDHPALRLHVGDVLLTGLRELDSLLPVCRKLILPSSMPFCFRLPPRIADANTSMRPVPNSVIAALSNHGSPARWACSGKPRLSLATLAFNICELHSLSCPQPQSGAIVVAKRGALEGTFDVRNGSDASVWPSDLHVRSTPNSRHFRTRSALRIWAKSRHHKTICAVRFLCVLWLAPRIRGTACQR